jgi:peptide/nickel transport system permease protein
MSGADTHLPPGFVADVVSEPIAAPVTRRRRFGLVPALPLAVIGLFVFVAIFAPFLTPYDPNKNDLISSLLPPAFVQGGVPEHPLGTDDFGRDVLARLMYGARVSLSVAAFSLVIAVIIGTIVGVSAGYFGGAIDGFLMRVTDIFLAFPRLVLALAFVAALRPGVTSAVIAIALTAWPPLARLARSETLTIRRSDYISAVRLTGASPARIVLRHIAPLCVPTMIVRVALDTSGIIMTAAGLGFLGMGAQPPMPEWGTMIATMRSRL